MCECECQPASNDHSRLADDEDGDESVCGTQVDGWGDRAQTAAAAVISGIGLFAVHRQLYPLQFVHYSTVVQCTEEPRNALFPLATEAAAAAAAAET